MQTMIRTTPYYFERWARNRALVARVRAALESGLRVTIGTYTKATTYDSRHLAMFKATPTGALVQHGKRWDDFSHCAVVVTL
jgi:hypothetical protein